MTRPRGAKGDRGVKQTSGDHIISRKQETCATGPKSWFFVKISAQLRPPEITGLESASADRLRNNKNLFCGRVFHFAPGGITTHINIASVWIERVVNIARLARDWFRGGKLRPRSRRGFGCGGRLSAGARTG